MMPDWSRQVSQNADNEIAACCKGLKLSTIWWKWRTCYRRQPPGNSLKLLRSELEHRETQRKDKFLKMPGFTHQDFRRIPLDEVTLPAAVLRIISGAANLSYQNQPGDVWQCGYGKTFLSIALGVEACKKG